MRNDNKRYTVRAITRGKFVVPPTKAEEMYAPDMYHTSFHLYNIYTFFKLNRYGRSDMIAVHVK